MLSTARCTVPRTSVQPLKTQANPTAGDAGDFQQVIYQVGELTDLALDNRPDRSQSAVLILHPEQGDRVVDGGQRVAQLMR